MLQDQIAIYSSLQSLRLKCYACKQPNHLANICSMIHFYPDKEKTIKTFEFSYDQNRSTFVHRLPSKHSHSIYKAMKISAAEIEQTKEYESSDEENEGEDVEELDQDKKDKKASFLSKENSNTSKYFTQNSLEKTSQTIPRLSSVQPILQRSLPPQRILSLKNEKNKLAIPIEDDMSSHDKSSLKKFGLSGLTSESNKPPLKASTASIMPISYTSSTLIESSVLNIKSSMECFDKIHNYRNYFPNNNFNCIAYAYNEKNAWSKMHRRKKTEIKRLSKYTFSACSLYEKIKRKRDKRAKNGKNIKFANNIFIVNKNSSEQSAKFEKGSEISNNAKENKTLESSHKNGSGFLHLFSFVSKNKREKDIKKKLSVSVLKLWKK